MKNPFSISHKVMLVFEDPQITAAYSIILKGPRNAIVTVDKFQKAWKMVAKDRPHVIVCDPFSEDAEMGGLEFIHKVRQDFPGIKVLVVSDTYSEELIIDVFRAGAIGFVLYEKGIEELVRAFNDILCDGAPMSREVATCLVQSFQISPDNPLTRREQDVLRQVATGKSYQYIANELHISIDTIRTHVQHIFEKLEVKNKSEAVIKAKLQKLV